MRQRWGLRVHSDIIPQLLDRGEAFHEEHAGQTSFSGQWFQPGVFALTESLVDFHGAGCDLRLGKLIQDALTALLRQFEARVSIC